jgi:hypothetical protein
MVMNGFYCFASFCKIGEDIGCNQLWEISVLFLFNIDTREHSVPQGTSLKDNKLCMLVWLLFTIKQI